MMPSKKSLHLNFTGMNWLLVVEIIYVVILVLVCLKIIYDTRSHIKTLAYVLVAIFLPVIGMIFYFSFGINYRKHKLYSKKLFTDSDLARKLNQTIFRLSQISFEKGGDVVRSNRELALLLLKDSQSGLTSDNHVKLLINGEEKFPELLQAMNQAKEHIHIEYYIYDNDEIGKKVEDMMVKKAREGVKVRFIYDDFGSRSIRKGMVKRLRKAGVEAYPFHKIIFIALANRLNYRNHRKIVVIDGVTAFLGGINISDRYINVENHRQIYWRDTHIRLDGPGVHYLQYLFLCDWNFCADAPLEPTHGFFKLNEEFPVRGDKIVQIAASGPDSDTPTILYALLQAINLAEEEILITTPYFIPGESMLDSLVIAALGGVKVKLLVPYRSDSRLVDAAARSYYEELLKAGVEVYLYKKGFVHAKTLVADKKVAVVGTANMDARSFDLNFEVNAIVYDRSFAQELARVFEKDLLDAEKIDAERWINRGITHHLAEKTARLVSPLL